jgi:hypothetical protein
LNPKPKKSRTRASGQKPPKEDVQQTEEKKNACYTVAILAKNLEQTYYSALFFGKKQHFVVQTIGYVPSFCCFAKRYSCF